MFYEGFCASVAISFYSTFIYLENIFHRDEMFS